MPTEFSLGVTSVAFCNRRPRLDFRCTPSATKFARHCNMSRRARSGRETPREPGGGAVSWLSSRGMRTGNDEQSAAAFPFRTQAGIDERMRTGDCYRSVSNRQNECHDAERSRPSPHEIHEHSLMRGALWRASTSPANSICARTTLPPSCSRFTNSQIGGIVGHVRPHSNAGASITGSAVGPPNLDGSS